MLFNSIAFLLFFPVVFILYWLVFSRNVRLQNIFIILSSYFFYGWWSWKLLLLLIAVTIISYLSGLALAVFKYRNKQVWILRFAVFINIGILFLFKYYDFFIVNFVSAFQSIGINLNINPLYLMLPIGISFYIFQSLGYTIDVYNKKISPSKDLISFFAFISFFPQLLSGPIGRGNHLLPQFLSKRIFIYTEAVDGLRQILWGLFKKIVIADNCAILVNGIFENYNDVPASTLLLGAFFFTIQIYGDFSGYSDIAIGCAKLLGVQLGDNFNYPYFSRDIAEFWRKWHISLTTWFRDYVYIPLGGNRCTKIKVIRNTFIVFLVSGLWHGANWTFIVWGGYHAMLFLPLLVLNKKHRFHEIIADKSFFPSCSELRQMLVTFILVMFGWIIFRSNTILDAWGYIRNMCSYKTLFVTPVFPGIPIDILFLIILFSVIVFMFVQEWLNRKGKHGLDLHVVSQWRRFLLYTCILMLIFYYSSSVPTSFIYFQF